MIIPWSISAIGSDLRNRYAVGVALYAVLLLGCLEPVGAYETDQISNRLEDIEDSTAVLNERVNAALVEIAGKWRGPRSDKRFVMKVYHKLGGHHWVDKLERWVMNSDQVAKLSTRPHQSIYSGHPITATRVTKLFGVGPTIKLNNHLVGSDKIGHFFSQGKKYYLRWRRTGSEEQAARRSAYTERAIFGQGTTGSYSNADLVANYEGHRFYRSLFEDGIIAGKAAILAWQNDHWVVQRRFDWADHVNAYWDEALNFNHYDRMLYKHMLKRLVNFCADYNQQPERYQIENEAALIEKYSFLLLRDTSEYRLQNLCDPQSREVTMEND